MSAPGDAKLQRRLIRLAQRILLRLRWFPFTLLLLLLNAFVNFMQLWRRRVIVPVGEVLGEAPTLPRDAMMWLDGVPAAPAAHHLEICLRLSPQAADANLQDVFSAVLTFPRFRSIGLYWDSPSLTDDLPLWRGRGETVHATPSDLRAPVAARLSGFLHARHTEMALPVAASRDAETFIKRRAGGAWVVCVNLPGELCLDVEALAAARRDIHFLGFPSGSDTARALNFESVFAHGFTLHERMALIRAADGYIGGIDELGCTALISGRPSLVIDRGDGDNWVRTARRDGGGWVHSAFNPSAGLEEVTEFLSRHF